MWAIFHKDYNLASLFWKLGGNAIPNALIASTLCLGIKQHDKLQEGRFNDTTADFEKLRFQFEAKAIDVMELCYDADADKKQYVLEADLTTYVWLDDAGKYFDCLDLAQISGSQKFIGQAACQSVIERAWKKETLPISKGDIEAQIAGSAATEPPPFGYGFSPKLKFNLDCVAYFGLMVLYSYVALAKLEDSISDPEMVLGFWFLALAVDEIRQTASMDGFTWLAFRKWYRERANQMDLLMYSVYLLAIMLRLEYENDTNNMRWVKGLYGINVIQVYFRSLELMKALPQIGPKIIIFFKLFDTLFQFFVLLLVFIFAYGIFVQAAAHPFSKSSTARDWGDILWRVWYRPYFQVRGGTGQAV